MVSPQRKSRAPWRYPRSVNGMRRRLTALVVLFAVLVGVFPWTALAGAYTGIPYEVTRPQLSSQSRPGPGGGLGADRPTGTVVTGQLGISNNIMSPNTKWEEMVALRCLVQARGDSAYRSVPQDRQRVAVSVVSAVALLGTGVTGDEVTEAIRSTMGEGYDIDALGLSDSDLERGGDIVATALIRNALDDGDQLKGYEGILIDRSVAPSGRDRALYNPDASLPANLGLQQGCATMVKVESSKLSFTDILKPGNLNQALTMMMLWPVLGFSEWIFNWTSGPALRMNLFTPHVERGETFLSVQGMFGDEDCRDENNMVDQRCEEFQRYGFDTAIADSAALKRSDNVILGSSSLWLQASIALRPIAAIAISAFLAWGALTHFWTTNTQRNLHWRRLLPRTVLALALLLLMPALVSWGITGSNVFVKALFEDPNYCLTAGQAGVDCGTALSGIARTIELSTIPGQDALGGVVDAFAGLSAINMIYKAFVLVLMSMVMVFLMVLGLARQLLLVGLIVSMPVIMILLMGEHGARWLTRWVRLMIAALALPMYTAVILKLAMMLNPALLSENPAFIARFAGMLLLLLALFLILKGFQWLRNWAFETPGKNYFRQSQRWAAGKAKQAATGAAIGAATGGVGAAAMMGAGGGGVSQVAGAKLGLLLRQRGLRLGGRKASAAAASDTPPKGAGKVKKATAAVRDGAPGSTINLTNPEGGEGAEAGLGAGGRAADTSSAEAGAAPGAIAPRPAESAEGSPLGHAASKESVAARIQKVVLDTQPGATATAGPIATSARQQDPARRVQVSPSNPDQRARRGGAGRGGLAGAPPTNPNPSFGGAPPASAASEGAPQPPNPQNQKPPPPNPQQQPRKPPPRR
jgi:hypothetical protein